MQRWPLPDEKDMRKRDTTHMRGERAAEAGMNPLVSRIRGRRWGWAWAVLLAVLVGGLRPTPAYAWDLWLVTSDHRILVVRDVDRAPVQTVRLTHDPVPGAYNQALGSFAFAPNGRLYGISLTLGAPAGFYELNPDTGALAYIGDFPFQWGNTLYFHPRTGRGYTGGGLESWFPYELLHGFYVFTGYDPATTVLWHDMRGDFPGGGYTVGYAHHQGALYALWGTGNMYAHTIYLLRITEDDAGNFVTYTNLGDVESNGIPEGGWDLISDGAQLYIISPYALYRVELDATPLRFTRVFDFDLQPGETVNAGTAPWADLRVVWEPAGGVVRQGAVTTLTVVVDNAGPHPAEGVRVQLAWPATGWLLQGATPTQGVFDPGTRQWDVGTLAPGQQARLVLRGAGQTVGARTFSAEIIASTALDPDSAATAGPDTDDWGDGLPDDDEAVVTLTVAPALPQTGFAPGRVTPLPARPPQPAYTPTRLTLEIPRLGVQAPIWGVPAGPRGWDVTWLHDAVGWLHGSAYPTWTGNTVLTGHVWNADGTRGVFYGLPKLTYGDVVRVRTSDTVVTYRVAERAWLAPDAVETAFAPADGDVLTLLTCAGYRPEQDAYAGRWMVRAVRANAP